MSMVFCETDEIMKRVRLGQRSFRCIARWSRNLSDSMFHLPSLGCWKTPEHVGVLCLIINACFYVKTLICGAYIYSSATRPSYTPFLCGTTAFHICVLAFSD